MKRLFTLLLLTLCVPAMTCSASSTHGQVWKKIDSGLAYAKISFRATDGSGRTNTLHAFKVNPRKFKLDVMTAAPNREMGEHIDSMAKRTGALVAVNGGFFTPEHKSIGLLVKSGKQINKLHNTSWWSVFAVHGGKPIILRPWQAKGKHNFQMAVQAGPRLVVNGSIPKLKTDHNNARTAIGITKKGRVIIVATEGSGLTMRELAEKMRAPSSKGGLACVNAMALDGGSSTQLYADADPVKLTISGLSRIPNGVGIFRK
jgi:exopolysaccharide biosynthesis protein